MSEREPVLWDNSNSKSIRYITVLRVDGDTATIQLGGHGPQVGDYLGLQNGVTPGWWRVVTSERSHYGTATDPVFHMALRRHIPKSETKEN